MSFYERSQNTSKRLLRKYGQGTIIYNAPAGEATPFADAPAPTPYSVDAVQAPESVKKQYIDGGYIVASDLMLVVSPFAVEPSMSGTMSINGEDYQIVMVDPATLEAASPVVWRVGCRK